MVTILAPRLMLSSIGIEVNMSYRVEDSNRRMICPSIGVDNFYEVCIIFTQPTIIFIHG